MTIMIERVNANSPAQAVKSRARGPTNTQLRAKQAVKGKQKARSQREAGRVKEGAGESN